MTRILLRTNTDAQPLMYNLLMRSLWNNANRRRPPVKGEANNTPSEDARVPSGSQPLDSNPPPFPITLLTRIEASTELTSDSRAFHP